MEIKLIQTQFIPLSKLEVNKGQVEGIPSNPRRLDDDAFAKLKKSIEERPGMLALRELCVYPHGNKFVVLGGNMRLRAMRELKYKEAPCKVIPEDTPLDELKAFVVVDNSSFGAWDYDALANEWDDLPLQDWGVPAWETKDEPAAPEVKEDDFNEDAEVETRCNPGDIWQLGEHRLMCGDSTDAAQVALLMNGETIDLLMTDPPYGINADKMTMGTGKQEYERGKWDETRPDIRPMLSIAKYTCIWGGNYFADVLPANNDWLCWHKNNDGLSFSEFELAWTNFGRNCRHITHHWGDEKKLHITMKPVEVIAWAIRQTKEDCKTILDLFGGSGTTLIASEQLGRRCFMMERDPHFCDVIISRWETFTGKTAQLITPGDKVS